MDLSSKEKSGMEKSQLPLNYPTSEWQLGCANFINPPVSLVPTESSFLNPSMSSSISFEDSLCPSIWDRRGGGFLTTSGAATLPQSFSPFPADSTFIERAARFSCFGSGGNFSNTVMYPLGVSEPVGPCSKGGSIQVSQVLSSTDALKAASVSQSFRKESHAVEADDNASPVIDYGSTEGSPAGKEQGGDLDSMADGTLGIEASNNDEAPFSAGREVVAKILDNPSGDASAKGVAANKRKRSIGHLESDRGAGLSSIKTAKENVETTPRGEQNLNSIISKSNARQGKENSQNSDSPKEDYIHVRARRGQATNSHSLAERARREKISERMKFLQDLVPGCSKVTGKAVMLDEIINYVQSLQRQVEFLSMKLAAVNPQIDLNFEGLLSKDIHQARGVASTIGFSPDMGMSYPQIHPSQHGLIQAGIPGIGTHSDLLRRTINSQLTTMNTYRDMTPQTGNTWDEGLHNVVQMSFGINAPLDVQELNGSVASSANMKVEP